MDKEITDKLGKATLKGKPFRAEMVKANLRRLLEKRKKNLTKPSEHAPPES